MGGEQVTRVLCVGEGAAGGLALLCGPWAALRYPMANANVVTFGTPWTGFNSPFSWTFEQLVVVHYLWPFGAPAPSNSERAPRHSSTALQSIAHCSCRVQRHAVQFNSWPQVLAPYYALVLTANYD